MSELDAQTILNLTAVLAHNLLAAYDRRTALTDPDGTTLPVYEPQLAQQLVRALEPGVVAFVARLTANLPPDFDAGPVLARFWADPAAAEALNQYGMDAPGGTRAAAEALLAAGWPGEWLEVGALEEALAAWAAASAEMARLDAAHLDTPNTTYEPDQPVSAGAPSPLHAEMAELVRALAADGLGLIDAGHVIAADGYTILFSWRRQSAGRDQVNEAHVVEETTAEPPALEPTASLPLPIDEPPNPPPPAPGPLPPPSLPSPSSSVDEVIPLRLDTAAPPQVTTGLPFDLAAAIRQATSPPLAPDDLTQHESAPFAAILPAGASFVSLRIQIAAPDCDIHGGDTRPVRLFPGRDGPAVYFQLTPRRAGPLSIIVTVYQETDWIGSTRLRTEAGAAVDAPRTGLVLNVVSQPLGETAVNRKALRDALDHAYSDAELRDLCFELEVEYEDLPGDGQAAKARELVTYCQRRGLLAALVACVMRDRPLLLGARG